MTVKKTGLRAAHFRGGVAGFASGRALGLMALGALVLACTPIDRKHGWVPDEELLSEVVVGVDTRDTVDETIGQPSATGVVRDGGYYYISSVFRRSGPRAPEVISRDLIAITFDGEGIVDGVQRFGLEDGRTVRLERRVTDSSVEDKTFLRQLAGSLGNFNPGSFIGQ